jgi:hypothetical protein
MLSVEQILHGSSMINILTLIFDNLVACNASLTLTRPDTERAQELVFIEIVVVETLEAIRPAANFEPVFNSVL